MADLNLMQTDAEEVAETDTEDNVTKYVIYCSENGGEWKKVATTKNLSYKVKNLEKGNSSLQAKFVCGKQIL